MKINFSVGGSSIQFTRDPVSGRAEAKTPNGTILLQNPLDLGTHVSLALTKEWRFAISGKNVLIEKKRPLLLAAFRPSGYRVFVDDKLIIQRSGT
jgi:hypothetical protein